MLDAVIVGAGPSGLAAAYELCKSGGRVIVLERLEQVGGLARTVAHDGCRYDIGPHRFFTRNQEVNQLFADVVSEDLQHTAVQPTADQPYFGQYQALPDRPRATP